MNKEGQDVTQAFVRGTAEVLRLAKLYGCKTALLKERSPSCGCGQIYDGTFTGTLVEGGRPHRPNAQAKRRHRLRRVPAP